MQIEIPDTVIDSIAAYLGVPIDSEEIIDFISEVSLREMEFPRGEQALACVLNHFDTASISARIEGKLDAFISDIKNGVA